MRSSADATIADTSDGRFTIINDPPIVGNIANVTLDEGAAFSASVSATDPEGGVLTATVSGVPGATAVRDGDNFVISWADTPDGPGSVPVVLTVTDEGISPRSVVRTFQVTTNNVAPTLNVSGPASVGQGQPYMLSLDAVDPGDDTVVNWEIDWGDGNTEIVAGDPDSAVHVYTGAPGNYTILASATDEDGTWDAAPLDVEVTALAPLQAASFSSTNAGFGVRFNRALDPQALNLYDGGPDPLVNLPQDVSAVAGRDVTVPIQLDTATGLDSVQLRLAFDSDALELRNVRKGSLTADFDWLQDRSTPGVLVVDMARMSALDGGRGSLLELDFHVRADVADGSYRLDLQWANLNDGRLTLTPAPKPGIDVTDGSIAVAQPAAAEQTSNVMLAASNLQTAATMQRGLQPSPVIDWNAGLRRPTPASVQLDSPAAKPNWSASFVDNLGKTDEEVNPNKRIKVKLPAVVSATKPLGSLRDR